MAGPKKKGASGRKPEGKAGRKLVKLSALSKAKLARVSVEQLWVMQPVEAAAMGRRRPKVSLCGCRTVCLA